MLPLSVMAAEGSIAGRSVAEMLEGARAEGIAVVFNTQLVPADLTVTVEPQARSGLPLLVEILAVHGLELRAVGPGAYAVVRTPAPVARANPVAVTALEEVVVTTSRYAFGADVTTSHALVSGEALKTMPRLGEDTLKAVERLPGVASNGVGGVPPVRGGDPGETLILLDGLVLYEPFHFKNFLSPVSLLDARFISGLDFYSGGFGAEYGDRMSGVIDAHSLMPAGPEHYEIGLSLFHLSGLAGGQFAAGNGAWLLSARQSNLDRVLSAIDSDVGHPKYADGFSRLTYAFNAATRVSFNVLGSRDEIDLNWDRSGETANAGYRNAYVWSTLEHEWSDTLAGELIASFTDVNNLREGSVDEPGRRVGNVFDERNFHVGGLDAGLRWQAGKWFHRFGAEARYLEAQYRYSSRVRFEPSLLFPDLPLQEQVRDLAAAPEGWKYSAYWSGRFDLTPSLVTEIGVRIEDQEYTGSEHSVQAGPRLSLLYRWSPDTRVRLSWGQYSQSQRINELAIEDGIATFARAQHATHAVASLDHDFSPDLALRIEAYRKEYSRLKVRYENLFDPLVLLPELQPDRVAIAPSAALAYGAELSLSWRPLGAWSGWFSYAWSEVEDVVDRAVVRSWDQKHAVSAGLKWVKGRWDVTLADTFHTGWPTTPVSLVGGTPVVGGRNTERLGSFNSLDVRVSRHFALPKGELEAWAEVTNLANQGNDCCVDYRVLTQPDGVVLDRQVDSWLGLVPSVGVLWKY